MTSKRVLVIANKNWEASALMNVLLEAKACPERFPWPVRLNHPLPPQSDWNRPQPRGVFQFQEATHGRSQEVQVEVWCIQDAMDPSVSSSSTKEKMRVLPTLFGQQGDSHTTPDFVIAFGTAGFPDEVSCNGCVFVGANAFLYDPYEGSKTGADNYWHSDMTSHVLPPTLLSGGLFDPHPEIFDDLIRSQVEARFIVPPMKPASQQHLIVARDYTAVGVVNITNYDDYAWADEKALHAFEATPEVAIEKAKLGSLETTHGIIRLQSEAPFLFVSGITDRIGHFNEDVGMRPYAQNFSCAHNAGVATAWLIPAIARYLSSEG